MATHFRIARTDENDAARVQAKKVLKEPANGKRAVLGELSNKVLKNVDSGKGKDFKANDAIFKNVKARVDTHWKKTDSAPVSVYSVSKPVTRSKSLKGLNNVGIAKGTKTASTVQPKVVHLTKGAEVKKVKVVNLKREESRLTRRSLTKLKQIRKQAEISSASSSARNSDEEDDYKIEKPDSPGTHSHKLIEEVENIDINDAWNPMLVSEYVNDIYNYLNQLEETFEIRENFLEGHKQINHKMRTILIDWINEVQYQYKLEIDTYHMTVSIIDRYLQLITDTPKKELQLVGVTAMFIASKYEELFPPDIDDFVYITDETYKKKQILEMEKRIVKVLDFHLGKPLPTHFLRRFSKAAKAADKNHQCAKYLIEMASIDYDTAHYKPSEIFTLPLVGGLNLMCQNGALEMVDLWPTSLIYEPSLSDEPLHERTKDLIAAAALYISLNLFPLVNSTEPKVWTKTLEHYTHYTVQHLTPIIQRLAKIVKNAPLMKVQSVYSKYQSSKFDRISVQPELQGSLMDKLIDGKLKP